MPNTLLNLLLIAVGLIGLTLGGEWLVQGASRLAAALGIRPVVISLTIVAIGTSVPELLVAIRASLAGANGIVAGNVIGSNIANVGLIVGLTGVIFPIRAHWQFIRREIPIMIGVLILGFVLALDGVISQTDGLILLIGFFAYNGFTIWMARRETPETDAEVRDAERSEGVLDGAGKPGNALLRLVAGLVLVLAGAEFLVSGAVEIAHQFAIPEVVIGITLVAVGTSLPELATSVAAARRKQSEIGLGNAVGSNIFNILFIFGVAAVLRPIPLEPRLIQFDMLVMLSFSVMLLILLFRTQMKRWQAAALLAAYFAFVIYTFML